MAKAKAQEVPTQINKMVEQFILLRDRIAQIKEGHKVELERFELVKDKLAGEMLKFLDDTGQTAAKTEFGTVHVTHRDQASLADPDSFMEYVVENGAYELMDRRANSTACREFAEEHGSLPPGVKINSTRTAGVRRA